MDVREHAILNLGGKCKECGSTKILHLHHIAYLPLSTRWNEKSDYRKRAKEALEHPERFELLCQECHLKHHDDLEPKRRAISRHEMRMFDEWMRKKYPDMKITIEPQNSVGRLHKKH